MVELPMVKASGIINGAVFPKIEESSDFILSEVVGVT